MSGQDGKDMFANECVNYSGVPGLGRGDRCKGL